MPDEIRHGERALAAAADALINDVVSTVRSHPEYVTAVNQLTDTVLNALLSNL